MMKNKINKIIILVILVTLLFVKPIIQTEAAVLVGVIKSKESTAPVIDGSLETSEWSNGESKTVTLYELNNTADTIQIQIMSVYNSAVKDIFLGITVPDTNATNDYLLIVFRTNESSTLILGETPGTMRFGNGNDMKIGYVHNNRTDDAYSLDYEPELVFDENDGGSTDIFGKCHTEDTQVTFEWTIPFDSGDSNGRDFKISVGVQMNCFIYYYDDENDKIYLQLRKSESDYDYCQIHLIGETSTASIPLLVTIFSITGIYTYAVLNRKRKK
jgi:hypothetical protein